jgi:hypothetical protein
VHFRTIWGNPVQRLPAAVSRLKASKLLRLSRRRVEGLIRDGVLSMAGGLVTIQSMVRAFGPSETWGTHACGSDKKGE